MNNENALFEEALQLCVELFKRAKEEIDNGHKKGLEFQIKDKKYKIIMWNGEEIPQWSNNDE